MNMKKIEELIERNVSREEAKKLLTEKEFKEFEKLLYMKSVLSEMQVKPPTDMEKRVLSKLAKKEKTERRFFGKKFNLVFAFIIIAVFVGVLITRGFIPSLSPVNPQTQNRAIAPPSGSSGNAGGISSQNKKGLQMSSPIAPDYLIKVVVSTETDAQKVRSVIRNYCKKALPNGICEIESENFEEFIKELGKYGKVEYKENSAVKDVTKTGITVKVEVIVQ